MLARRKSLLFLLTILASVVVVVVVVVVVAAVAVVVAEVVAAVVVVVVVVRAFHQVFEGEAVGGCTAKKGLAKTVALGGGGMRLTAPAWVLAQFGREVFCP